MRNVMNKLSQASMKKGLRSLLAVSVLLTVAACSDGDDVGDGRILNNMVLPLDNTLTLQCPDVGLVDEFCILDDPQNPYARAAIDDVTKFELAAGSPTPKSDFYLWGTAQARNPRGENQYYTALALHRLYSRDLSNIAARDQAKRAYRSVLDNYFGSVTYFLVGDLLIPQPLKELVGKHIYSPSDDRLPQLFDSQADAVAHLDQWGYIYDVSSAFLVRK